MMALWPGQMALAPWMGRRSEDPFGFDFGLPPAPPTAPLYVPGTHPRTRRRVERLPAQLGEASGGNVAGNMAAGAAGEGEAAGSAEGRPHFREPYTVGASGWVRSIPVDFIEREEEYVMVADMPGARKNEVHVDVHPPHILRFGHKRGAEREREEAEERGVYLRAERVSSFRTRNLRMPEDADLQAELMASYQDGVLSVRVPKKKVGRHAPREVGVA